MATNYNDLLKNKNDFTKSQQNVNIKVNDRQNNRTHTTMNNALKALNETQRKNIQSAYKAKTSGIISDKQYQDNLKKNGVSDSLINPQKAVKPDSQNISIPKEKKERERLMDITGAYNLNKVNPSELQKHIRLEKKTPDDYHDVNQPYHIAKKRINEAFGPKTDFSISNYENNFDKMNKEEQSMLIYKMQKTFNKIGYTDFNGEKLKEDGVYGNKTKSVYEKYKKDNSEDYIETIENKKSFSTPVSPVSVTPEENTHITLASLTKEPTKVTSRSNQTNEKKSNIPMNTELSSQKFSPEIYYSYEEFDHPEDVKKRAENPKIIEKADNVIKDNAEFIKKAAKEYGVNPGILGACIYAEHVLNVNTFDSLTDVFAGNRGVDTSIGVSQVKLSTAKMVEDAGYMPKIESLNDSSLIGFLGGNINLQRVKALEDPETNIMYAAAYLKYFQDNWEEVYPEIDGTTAILATLFNQGERRSPHGNPIPNDFVRFARNNYFHINTLLGI